MLRVPLGCLNNPRSDEILANLEEDTGLVETNDGVREVELLEDDAGVVREMGDVVLEVLAGLGAAQCGQRVFGGVVERVACCLPEN